MWRLLFLLPLSLWAELTALYLSWYDDPTTTMAIQWHTKQEEPLKDLYLQLPDESWILYTAEPTSLGERLVFKVPVEHLAADTEYTFQIGHHSPCYKFRTAPSTLDKPLRFCVGGDLFLSRKIFRRMNQIALANDPLFTVLGGDIAYALPDHSLRLRSNPLSRWFSFFSEWKDQMITADGRVIPFILVPGNHDIQPDDYETFFSLFAFSEQRLYRSLDFGAYLSLTLLDTGHFEPIEGEQTHWLDQTLAARTHIPYRFAVYHEAAYPSFYPYHSACPEKIRTHWCPLFEKYNLLAAFEHHNHAYKRTYPIKAEKIDPAGVIYFGDGCWGAKPRPTHDRWYLTQRARKSSLFLVELTPENALIQAINPLNQAFDEVIIPIVSEYPIK